MSGNVSSNGSSLSPGKFELFATWKEYECIAMHFNDLLLRIRSQSLAAVAAFATIAGVFLKSEAVEAPFHWGVLAFVFAALAVFWIAIWILDFCYYNRLLLGAVKALIEIEESSNDSDALANINLSTRIKEAVEAPWLRRTNGRWWWVSRGKFPAPSACWWFYSLVLVVLLAGMIGSYCLHSSS